MIDTISLTVKDFEVENGRLFSVVKPIQKWNEEGREIKEEKLLFQDRNSNSYYGKSAFLNYDGVRVDLYQSRHGTKIMKIAFEVPIQAGCAHSGFSVGKTGLKTALKTVQGKLTEKGVHFSNEGLKVSRLDLFKNIPLEGGVIENHQVLKMLSLPYSSESKEYFSGYTISNTQRQVCFYDKYLQLLEVKGIEEKALRGVIRSEYRLLNSDSVKGAGLDFKQVSDYDSLKDAYRGFFDKVFKGVSSTSNDLILSSLAGKYQACKANKKPDVFIMALLIESGGFIDIEEVLERLDREGAFDKSSNHHSREKKRLRDAFKMAISLASKEKITVLERYEQFKKALLA